MPRRPRVVFPGIPHHVTQRGNRRGDVYFSDADRTTYLDWFGEYCKAHRVEVLAYCLMSNHMHAVVVPAGERALERVFRALHTRFAMRINRNHEWSGHLWQGRYFSAALDEAYLWAAIRYVERNPVRAGMVRRAEDYRWSSAAAHCGARTDPLLTQERAWLGAIDFGQLWSQWLAETDDPAKVEVLRDNVQRGLPCGNPLFVAALQRDTSLSLKPARRGRPRKPRDGEVRP